MRIHFTTWVLPVVVAAGISLSASAVYAEPVTTTEHEFKAVNVLVHIENPCTGVLGTLTEVENGVADLTAAGVDPGDPGDPADDRPIPPYTSTFNVENHFSFVPDDPNQPSDVGHSHTHISERFAAFPGTVQFENNIRAKGTTVRFSGCGRWRAPSSAPMGRCGSSSTVRHVNPAEAAFWSTRRPAPRDARV